MSLLFHVDSLSYTQTPFQTFSGMPFPDDPSPPDQWDSLPEAAKWQIILFIGFLEMFSEMAGRHYMRGGQPGKFPAFSDFPNLIPHPVPYDLFDPFGYSVSKSAEDRERGLISELNNGTYSVVGDRNDPQSLVRSLNTLVTIHRPPRHDWHHGLPGGKQGTGVGPTVVQDW